MDTSEPGTTVRRRQFLQAATLVAGGGALAGLSRPAIAQETDLEAWFADVSNYEGVLDAGGQSDVTITVGAPGNGGGFAFEPAAVRIDPGTTVRWEWTGEGGSHDVAAEDDSYASELLGDSGDTFSHTFESDGVSTYACTPHKSMGMKGAVIVGDVETPGLAPVGPTFVQDEPEYSDWFDRTDSFEGTLDMRGNDEVRIQARTDETSGEYAFSPPAVHVDPGTRVIWEWGDGESSHRIEAEDGSYESPDQSSGAWGLEFDGVGVSKYTSSEYDGQGMRGAIVVGDLSQGTYEISTSGLTILGALGAAVLSPIAFGAFLLTGDRSTAPPEEQSR
jgi:halocyanin-like protein